MLNNAVFVRLFTFVVVVTLPRGQSFCCVFFIWVYICHGVYFCLLVRRGIDFLFSYAKPSDFGVILGLLEASKML